METHRLAIFQSDADVIGYVLAPAPIVAVGIVECMRYTRFDAVAVLIFSLITYVAALGLTLFPGFVLYRLLVKLSVFHWWTSMLAGFAVGALATIAIAHPAQAVSRGVLINASAAAVSGLLFWGVQRTRHSATAR